MKQFIVPLALLFSCLSAIAQQKTPYDAALADSLGADKYGMKIYTFVILKTGSKTFEKAEQDSLLRGHMENMGRLVKEGKLVVAGPFQKNKDNYRGLFILNVKTPEEANLVLSTDPSVKAGLFDTELYQWYGSAALPLYLPYHQTVQKPDK